ncbi:MULTISPECIES: FUSC family protein [Klebsiella pneumoniae complex]|uniref:FUSC family protein n=1 Tax=Klebsiella pneumoniae complex TaxID=3390273 RepID=UPI002380791D|nr:MULTISPECIES: FUSC family protein [Klebsiella]MDE4730362.1 FUSC family protein [Klebsiella pneumoniae]MDE4740304.1 FUSC family protein [Klebsiella pneumoniae]MDE4750031.1 FUSC family protein [Klebsiella pneumoniae]MDE4766072.1 FUSC family protein [Klebsiella pneumoniae]MDE4782033.1 FUSC family protein [Klebsiella quasipneumoniae subsp. similipneumoniae]
MKKSIISIKRNRPINTIELKTYRNYRIIHAIRVSVSFVLTFLLMRLLKLPDHSWPLITIVVVMGPVSYVGNVIPRAIERIAGTLTGAVFGIVALHLEIYSLTLMILWCGFAAFFCGYLSLSKHPYAALLIGITLAVVSSAPTGDIQTALWRSANIIIGCALAMIFTSIYPQRAFINWRIQLSDFLTEFSKITTVGMSHNLISQPILGKLQKNALNKVVKMRSLIVPISKETNISKELLEEIQSVIRDIIAIQKLQIKAHWASRGSRFLILNSQTLTEIHHATIKTLDNLSVALCKGNPSSISIESKRLGKIAKELHCLLNSKDFNEVMESTIYGYVWLSVQLADYLEKLSSLITDALVE